MAYLRYDSDFSETWSKHTGDSPPTSHESSWTPPTGIFIYLHVRVQLQCPLCLSNEKDPRQELSLSLLGTTSTSCFISRTYPGRPWEILQHSSDFSHLSNSHAACPRPVLLGRALILFFLPWTSVCQAGRGRTGPQDLPALVSNLGHYLDQTVNSSTKTSTITQKTA